MPLSRCLPFRASFPAGVTTTSSSLLSLSLADSYSRSSLVPSTPVAAPSQFCHLSFLLRCSGRRAEWRGMALGLPLSSFLPFCCVSYTPFSSRRTLPPTLLPFLFSSSRISRSRILSPKLRLSHFSPHFVQCFFLYLERPFLRPSFCSQVPLLLSSADGSFSLSAYNLSSFLDFFTLVYLLH